LIDGGGNGIINDSFESVEEELTQQCNLIASRTPKK
jgi:hypothetical protein